MKVTSLHDILKQWTEIAETRFHDSNTFKDLKEGEITHRSHQGLFLEEPVLTATFLLDEFSTFEIQLSRPGGMLLCSSDKVWTLDQKPLSVQLHAYWKHKYWAWDPEFVHGATEPADPHEIDAAHNEYMGKWLLDLAAGYEQASEADVTNPGQMHRYKKLNGFRELSFKFTVCEALVPISVESFEGKTENYKLFRLNASPTSLVGMPQLELFEEVLLEWSDG